MRQGARTGVGVGVGELGKPSLWGRDRPLLSRAGHGVRQDFLTGFGNLAPFSAIQPQLRALSGREEGTHKPPKSPDALLDPYLSCQPQNRASLAVGPNLGLICHPWSYFSLGGHGNRPACRQASAVSMCLGLSSLSTKGQKNRDGQHRPSSTVLLAFVRSASASLAWCDIGSQRGGCLGFRKRLRAR